MSHLAGQVAIVTGGGSGIGLAVAGALLAEGVSVVISGRDDGKLERAATGLDPAGKRVLPVRADVTRQGDVDELVRKTLGAFGRVDVLVNNAGIGKWGMVTNLSEADWEEVLAVNLKGAFLCSKAVLPEMTRRKSGYIVNISSLSGKEGSAGGSAYSASKFGLMGLSQSLLEEVLPEGIKVTALCPGYVATPMVESVRVPASEMIPPGDIGRLIVGLLHLSPVTVIREIVVERKGAVGT